MKKKFRLALLFKIFDLDKIAIFAVLFITSYFLMSWNKALSVCFIVLDVILLIASLALGIHRYLNLDRIIQSEILDIESATSSLINFPLPMAIVTGDALIVWGNTSFLRIFSGETGKTEIGYKKDMITELLPEKDFSALMNPNHKLPIETKISQKIYKTYAVQVKKNVPSAGEMAVLYFDDITDYRFLRTKWIMSRPVVINMTIDNYEDFFQSLGDMEKAEARMSIYSVIGAWAERFGAYLKQLDPQRFLLIIEENGFRKMSESRFDILEKIREVYVNRQPITLSIGIGKDGDDIAQNGQFASDALERAQRRGGDYVVIRSKNGVESIGGSAAENAKRSRVRSRILARAVGEYIDACSEVFISGHKFADLDAIGAAIGIARISMSRGKPVHILTTPQTGLSPVPDVIAMIKETIPQYQEIFVLPTDERLNSIDKDALVFIVDANTPAQVEAESILMKCKTRILIDHHILSGERINDLALEILEPSASSACELVSEILSYLDIGEQIKRIEAETMLAGIMLDSKNFVLKTSDRTFEAAAFLRREGALPLEVKKNFRDNMDTYRQKMLVMARARLYKNGAIAVASAPADTDISKPAAAAAADDLMNISGVDASFVMTQIGNNIHLSCRSYGIVNVSQIAEKLGGGGHRIMSACVFHDKTYEEAEKLLFTAINEYYSSISKSDS